MSSTTSITNINAESILKNIFQAFSGIAWTTWGYALLYIIAGFICATFTSSIIARILSKYTSAHYTQLAKRVFYYGILMLSVVIALITLHLDAKVLGIATVLTIALGFASQTAVSNTISGLFLVFERPFVVGDQLEINNVKGELLSIDLLSIKLRTFNNEFIRIPNENLLKTQFTNLTRFPIRRLKIPFKVSLKEDINRVKKILLEVANNEPAALKSPNPELFFECFEENHIELVFAVWSRTQTFMAFKNNIALKIHQAFRENGIMQPVTQYNITMPPQAPTPSPSS
jgi:small-conductance mechanosensitive channel